MAFDSCRRMLLWLESRIERGGEEIELICKEMSAMHLHYQKRRAAYETWYRETREASIQLAMWRKQALQTVQVCVLCR